jgi:hypothetical protein
MNGINKGMWCHITTFQAQLQRFRNEVQRKSRPRELQMDVILIYLHMTALRNTEQCSA